MAKIPDVLDPTLMAIDRQMEAAQNRGGPRPYLGMSAIGGPCRRKLWYEFRWVRPASFDAATLKRFADGHLQEDVQAERLRMVDGVTLLTVDPETGRQFGYVDCDGHFKGHSDGKIHGLVQAPTQWSVWEHKSTGEDKLAKLVKAKREFGEKNALEQWDETYFGQAQLYMHYSGHHRHYLTCSTPGGRTTISVRTEYNRDAAERLIAKARQIIDSPTPPARLSDDPAFYRCRWCDHATACHKTAPEWVARNCRTCIFSAPVANGDWHCGHWNDTIPAHVQGTGCPQQRYLPDLVPGEQIDASPDGAEWIEYRLTDGTIWVDGVKDGADFIDRMAEQ